MEDHMEQSSSTRKKTHTIDEAIERLGGFYYFQWMVALALTVMSFPVDASNYVMVFHSFNPSWRCVSNSSICLLNSTRPNTDDTRCNLPRSEWEYTVPQDYSISMEFDLVCGREWMQTLLSSIIYIGWGTGALVLGYLADNYGRKRVIYFSVLMITVVGSVMSFLHSVPLIILCRLIVGFFVPGEGCESFVLVSEYVDTKRRPFATLFVFAMTIPNKLLLLLKAYYIRRWRILQLVCLAPYVVMALTYFLVPESIRWMRVKGKDDELNKTLKRMAYWNRREFPSDLKIEAINEKVIHHKFSLIDIFKPLRLAITSCILGYVWLVNGMIYYAFYYAGGSLGGSIYFNFLVMVFVSLPSEVIAAFLSRVIGRKKTTIVGMLAASIFCLTIAFINGEDKYIARVTCAGLGNLFIGVSFSTIYTWSVEIYPTTKRANGMGFLQVTSRIGAASAPWVATGLRLVHPSAPYIVMSATSFVGTFLLFWLPETSQRPTLDADEDRDVCMEQKEMMENIID